MWILVFQPSAREQRATLNQSLDHGLICVALFALVVDDALAGEAGGLFGEGAVLVHGVGNGRVNAAMPELAGISRPYFEVLAAVTGRGMNEPGTGILGHVIAGEK